MRLADQIVQSGWAADSSLTSEDRQAVEELYSANPRFVLDQLASNACGDLIRAADELFEPGNPLIRMPAEHFWVEAFQEPPEAGEDPRNTRIGVLVRADPDGRSGFARHFYERPGGGWARLPGWTEFDFDRRLAPRDADSFTLSHAILEHIAKFLKHSLLHAEPSFLARFKPQDRGQQLRRLAEAAWFDLPLVAAFGALLASPGIVDSRPADLVRLNQARARKHKPALLDHVEVRLVLGNSTRSEGHHGTGQRTAPRLHYVRGHFVHRAGKSFWRCAHLRGDSSKSVIQRTVRVTASTNSRRAA